MSVNEIPCPSCGAIGFIRWDEKNCYYSCYVCDSITPPAFVPQERAAAPYQIQVTPNKETSDFMDDEYEDDELFEDDPFSSIPEWDEDEDIIPEEGLLEPVYQNSFDTSMELDMAATKSKNGELTCAVCGKTRTQRNEKIKRLYGENKDRCLACYRKPNKSPKVETAPQKSIKLKREKGSFVLFDNEGKYVGRFSSQEELASVATKLGSFEAFRLQPLRAKMTVKFED